MITKLLLVELCLTFATSIVIRQDIPRNDSYRCPGGPTLQLKCKFAAGAIAVFWSFGETTIPVGYPGHEINNDMIHSGESYLRVNRSSDLKDSYRCIAIFPDSSSQEQTIEDFPEPANVTMKWCPGEINASSIQITWNNTFPECFNFSVLVDGQIMQNESADKLHYTVAISALSPNTTHNVCVVAQDGLDRTNKHWRHCNNITTTTTNATATKAEMKPYFPFDSNIGILVGTLITIVSVICLLALIVCLALMCKHFFSHKAVQNEKKWPAGRTPMDMQKQTTNSVVDKI